MWEKSNGEVVAHLYGARLTVHGGRNAVLDDIIIGSFHLVHGAFGLHVYVGPLLKSTKVFSAHLADRAVTDGDRWKYYAGRCMVMTWKRGKWEDQIMAQRAEPRTIAHVLTAGPTRRK